MSNKASTGYTDELKIYVADAKRSTKNRKEFMEWERQRAYDKEEGIAIGEERGRTEQAIETAKKLLNDKKYTVEEISALLNIPVEAFVQTVEA